MLTKIKQFLFECCMPPTAFVVIVQDDGDASVYIPNYPDDHASPGVATTMRLMAVLADETVQKCADEQVSVRSAEN